jgi:hypothetical protein
MKNMKTKMIATILALGMIAGAFAMMATPVKAASYHAFCMYDLIDGSVERIVDSDGGVNPNGGINRFWKATEPQFVNQGFTTLGGTPYVGMSDTIGFNGQAAGDYYSMTQTFGGAGPTDVLPGDSIYSALELDANRGAEPRTYYSTVDGGAGYGWTVVGAVPNGYLWAGNHIAIADADEEVFPGTAPATTFFKMYQMPAVTFTDDTTNNWAFPAHEADVPGNTASCIESWVLMEGAAAGDNDGPWTQVGVTQPYGTAITYDRTPDFYYCVRIIWDGAVNSAVLSQPLQNIEVVGSTFAPEASALLSTPATHNGNTVTEYVTITATITESIADTTPDTINGAQLRVDGGAPVAMAAVDGAFDGEASEAVTGQFDFPSPFTEGVHTFEVHGSDTGDGYNATWMSGTFTVTDTTAPVAAWGMVPGATAYIGNNLVFTATYEDFSNYQAAGSYLTWSLNGVPQANVPLVGVQTGWGSYLYTATATIPTGGFVAGDVITYNGQVTAASVGPQTTVLGAGGPITMADPPTFMDPFPVYGYVSLYDGTFAGGFDPTPQIGATVTVSWYDVSFGGVNTTTGVTNGLGQFSIDIHHGMVGDPLAYGIEISSTATTGNIGYNWTAIADWMAMGGVWMDVLCGVPYDVNITNPVEIPVPNVYATIGFPVTYEIVDIDGVLAPGYFTFADGPMLWHSNDTTFASPPSAWFNGTASATPGTWTGNLVLSEPGFKYINVTENDLSDFYLTPFDAIAYQIGGVAVPGYLKDWDNITVFVLAGGFDWNCVAFGWNIVSAPQDPLSKGTDAIFDAGDALQVCWNHNGTNDNALQIAERQVDGSYITWTIPDGEGGFPIDGVHSYWVYAEVAQIVTFLALDYAYGGGDNILAAAMGWNMVGFTHNYTTWTWIPNSAMFMNATIDADLAGVDKIIATQWDYSTQMYVSYVEQAGFPGMPEKLWSWDLSYSNQPGNGLFLWLEAGVTIEFNVLF